MSISKRGLPNGRASSSAKSTDEASSSPARASSLKHFAKERALHLIDKLQERMSQAREARASAESVHDLRTGIRRLSECLRAFDAVFAQGHAARLRRKLRKLMDLAAEVRNRDISAELFREAGVAQSDPTFSRLQAEQEIQKQLLRSKLERWADSKRAEHWRGLVR